MGLLSAAADENAAGDGIARYRGQGSEYAGATKRPPSCRGLERAGTTARCATAFYMIWRACSRVIRALSRRKGPKYVLKTGQRKMSKRRMDWRRARLHGKPTLDHRYEFDPDYADAAARWLRKAENRQRERRTLTASSSAVVVRSSR
jgi:hypothetical protein